MLCCAQLHPAWLGNTSRDGASTASQCLTTIWVKKFFLISDLCLALILPSFSLNSLLLSFFFFFFFFSFFFFCYSLHLCYKEVCWLEVRIKYQYVFSCLCVHINIFLYNVPILTLSHRPVCGKAQKRYYYPHCHSSYYKYEIDKKSSCTSLCQS